MQQRFLERKSKAKQNKLDHSFITRIPNTLFLLILYCCYEFMFKILLLLFVLL